MRSTGMLRAHVLHHVQRGRTVGDRLHAADEAALADQQLTVHGCAQRLSGKGRPQRTASAAAAFSAM